MVVWMQRLEAARHEIHLVDLVTQLRTPAAWRLFMQHHVFAVWDFMSLLKRLQRELTGLQLPWTPPADPQAARLINEMVLAEESDEDGRGGYQSHFNLYRRAMAEAGASTQAIDTCCAAVACGTDWAQALVQARVPTSVAAFVGTTLRTALSGKPHEVAAAFLFGREALLPNLFRQLLAEIDRTHPGFATLHFYFTRHVELDEGAHAPMAHQLLERMCSGDPARQQEAEAAALAALAARKGLWQGMAEALQSLKA